MALKWLYMNCLAHRTGAILVPVRCAKLLEVSWLGATLVGRHARSALLRFLFDEAVADKADAECGDAKEEDAGPGVRSCVEEIDGKKDIEADIADDVFRIAAKLQEILLVPNGGNEGVCDDGDDEDCAQDEENGLQGLQLQETIAKEEECSHQFQLV